MIDKIMALGGRSQVLVTRDSNPNRYYASVKSKAVVDEEMLNNQNYSLEDRIKITDRIILRGSIKNEVLRGINRLIMFSDVKNVPIEVIDACEIVGGVHTGGLCPRKRLACEDQRYQANLSRQ